MKFGLDELTIEKIQNVFALFPQVDKAILYGSRAKGNYRPGSDIDLTLRGDNLGLTVMNQIGLKLDDLLLPYTIDISVSSHIKNEELLEHIDRVGLEFYSRWAQRTLSEKGCLFLSGYAFKSSDYLNDGIPLIKIGNIQNRIVEIDCNGDYIREDVVDKSISRYMLSNNDVLIAMTGQGSVGRVGRLKLKNGQSALLNQRVGKFICDEVSLNIDYLYYVLTSDKYQDLLFNTGSGSGQPNLSPQQILGTEIPWISYPNQIAIASVLNGFDEKIDLLERQNKTLEQLAETIFRQWFVEEAKESWGETSLFDVITLVGGGTPKTDNLQFWNGNIKWISAKDITPNHKRFIMTTEKTISEPGLKNSSTKILEKYSTIISARGTVGKYCLLSEPMAFSQSNYGITPKYKNLYFFTYLLIAYSVEELQAAAYGSVFDTITTNTFKEHKINIPSQSELFDFEKKITPYFKKMESNQTQIQSLTKMRDTLLPKLMSGEVRVKI